MHADSPVAVAVPLKPDTTTVGRRCLVRVAMAILIGLQATGGAFAADEPPPPLAGYTLTSWTRTDGLPPGNVWALAQDARGYLWLGADAGLLRFDGSRFANAEALGLATLPQDSIQTLLAASDGSLWIGFTSAGISRIQDGAVTTWTEVEGNAVGNVTSIVQESTGTLLAIEGERLLRFEGGRWTRWTRAPAGPAHSMHTGAAGDLMLVAGRKVLLRRPGADTFEVLASATENFRPSTQTIAQDESGGVWLIDGVAGFRRLRGRDRGQRQLQAGRGAALMRDRRGNLWIATFGQGLWRVPVGTADTGDRIERVNDLAGLSSSSVLSLLEDRDGNIWAGTAYGLDRLTPHRFDQVNDLGLVMGVESTGDGTLWVATDNGVVQLVPKGETPRAARRHLEGLTTRALHAAASGTVWAATNRGLYRLQNGQSERVITEAAGAALNVSGLTSDGGGGLWLYDEMLGLLRWRDSTITAHPLPPAFRNARLGAVLTDRRGRAWLGFEQNRLVTIEPTGAFRVFGAPDGLEVGSARALYEDGAGTIWIVGSRGLARFADDRLVTLHQGDAFLTTLTSVIDGDDGHLWLGSSWGLVRMHPREIERAIHGRWADVTYDLFDVSDGVSGTARWTGLRNVARTRDGRLWFVTVRGLTVVDPAASRPAYVSSPVAIQDLIVDGRRMPASEAPTVASNARRLEINFTAPNLTSAAKTRFRYQLDGFDAGWVDAGTRRQAIYTNLPPQSYVFRVEASDQAGAWGGSRTTLAFSVSPAFYQTGWFYGAMVAAVALVVGGAWRLRLTTIRKNFALVLGERVRLSREIHDTLLQSLVGVSLQLDQVSHDVGTADGRQQVNAIRRQVDEYIREARESIWNLRSPALARSDLATALRRTGEQIAGSGVAFDFRMTGVPQRHSPLLEEQLLRIGQEAVTNAVRHSEAGRVSMELQYGDQAVTLRVADDGRGFERSGVASGHWGLQTMEERAAAVGGDFRLSSHPDAGTVVEAVIPAPPVLNGRE